VNERSHRPAFSLLELLVVVAVLGVLLGILLPVLAMGRGAAARTKCMVNLRELGVGLREYVRLENDGLLPLVHGYPDQMAEPGDFTDVLPLIARPRRHRRGLPREGGRVLWGAGHRFVRDG